MSARTGAMLAGIAGLVAVVVSTAVLWGPATDRSGNNPLGQSPLVVNQAGTQIGNLTRSLADDLRAVPRGRPARSPTLAEENRHSPPVQTVTPSWVSGIVAEAPVLLGDVALPWRYHVDNAVAGRVDEAAVHAGVADWNGHPGTRWRAEYAGTTDAPEPVADGLSTIFLEPDCAGLTNANAYLYTDGGLGIRRYGTAGTQILEADIGICPRIGAPDEVRRAVRHELGHVVGLAHLCNAGDDCWQPGMGEGDLGCRVMFWQARVCQNTVADHDVLGLQAIYPTLRPLAGPDAETTLARASFGAFADSSAPVAVVVTADVPAGVQAAAAALAARAAGGFLIGSPDEVACLTGNTRAEVNRSLRRRATLVLVGDWPSSCEQLGFDWDLDVRLVDTADPVGAQIDLAELREPGSAVVLAAAADVPGMIGADAVVAAALAAGQDDPLVTLPQAELPDRLLTWMADRGVVHATLVGAGLGDTVAATLSGTGIAVGTLAGEDRIATALLVADQRRASGVDGAVITPGDGSVEGLAAVVFAARDRDVLLLAGPEVEPRLVEWLRTTPPARGWYVGRFGGLADPVLAAYGVLVPG